MKKVDVVGAVIVNEKNEILCALRSQNMALPGLWEFPGGKIEPNEDPRDTLKREIQEELLCEIEVGEKITEVTHEYPNVIVHLITYYARIKNGEPKATEHEKIIWLAKDQLQTLTWAPADLPTLECLLSP